MSIKITIEFDIDAAKSEEVLRIAQELISISHKEKGVAVTAESGVRRQSPPRINRARNRKRPPLTGTLPERWTAFYSTMSQRTRDFADLIEAHAPDPVTQTRVMDLLDIDEPKTLGGLTGSLNRWSAAVEVELPWRTINHGGERAWIWAPLSERAKSPTNVGMDVEEDDGEYP